MIDFEQVPKNPKPATSILNSKFPKLVALAKNEIKCKPSQIGRTFCIGIHIEESFPAFKLKLKLSI